MMQSATFCEEEPKTVGLAICAASHTPANPNMHAAKAAKVFTILSFWIEGTAVTPSVRRRMLIAALH